MISQLIGVQKIKENKAWTNYIILIHDSNTSGYFQNKKIDFRDYQDFIKKIKQRRVIT